MEYLSLCWKTLEQTWQDLLNLYQAPVWGATQYSLLAILALFVVLRQFKLLILFVTSAFYGYGFYQIVAHMDLNSKKDWGHLGTYFLLGLFFFFILVYQLFIRPEDTKT